MKRSSKIKSCIYLFLNFYRIFWCMLLYLRAKNKSIIKEDLIQNVKGNLFYALLINKPFRSVFYYRVQNQKVLSKIAKFFIRPLDSIEIYISPDKIGGGFRLLHNIGAVITPYSAGKNLTVAQGVTIGGNIERDYPSGRHTPVLGDNVHVSTNAVVIGGITIGDNVMIGAGAVVTKDLPSNCVAAGVPAKVIKFKESVQD